MNENQASFEKVSFLGGIFRRGAEEAAEKLGPRKGVGQFVKNIEHDVPINPEQIHVYSPSEVKQIDTNHKIDEGIGGMVGDGLLGGVKFLTPKSVGNKINNGIAATKQFIEKWDTKLAQPLAGKDPSSLRGKLFSVPTGKNAAGHVVGEVRDEEGNVLDHLYRGSGGESRRASLLAPVQNGSKVMTPFLGAAYLGEKLYPNQSTPQQETYDELNKLSENISNDGEKHGILEGDYLSFQMDKQASLQKIAYLEDELEKYASQNQSLKEEIKLLSKEAKYQQDEKMKIHNNLHSTKRELLEKKAEYEEFRLRTIARERSQIAVKTAESMLEAGMIKQAQFNEQVDKLMECDEPTFNLYTSLLKEATKDEEGLESLAFLVDYRSNDIDSLPLAPQHGMSKKGQTIGQAARDLIK